MDIPPEASKVVPGMLGAISAVVLMRENLIRGIAMVAPAAAMSWYGSDFLATKVGMPVGLAGYLLGMFGMAGAAKLLETWEKFDLGGILGSFVRKVLGLPEKPES
jgi:hypothetical protein